MILKIDLLSMIERPVPVVRPLCDRPTGTMDDGKFTQASAVVLRHHTPSVPKVYRLKSVAI